MIFIDNNILVDLTKNPALQEAREWLKSLTEHPKVPLIVASELIIGSRNSQAFQKSKGKKTIF